MGCQFTRYDESPREKSPPAVPKVRDIGNTSKPTVHKMKREKRLNFGGSQTKSQEKSEIYTFQIYNNTLTKFVKYTKILFTKQ